MRISQMVTSVGLPPIPLSVFPPLPSPCILPQVRNLRSCIKVAVDFVSPECLKMV